MRRISLLVTIICAAFLQLSAQNSKQEKKANKSFYEQNYSSAMKQYSAILSSSPNNERAKYQLELCSLLVKDYRNRPLKTILDYAGTEGKSDRFYDYWLGRIYISRYRFEEGITALNAFLKLDRYKSPELIDSTKHYIDRAERSIVSYNDPKLYELEKVGTGINNNASQLTAVYFPPTNQMIYTDHTRPDNKITTYVTSLTGDNEWSTPQVFTAMGTLSNDDYDLEYLPPNRLLLKKERTIDIIPFENGNWAAAKPYIIKLQVKNKNAHFTINLEENLMIISEKDFLGRYDLYESDKKGDEWTKPVFIENINSPLDEHSPFITDDSQTLYFSSEGHDALGGHDVFISKRNGNSWTKPVNLGYPINTFDDELYFSINNDGTGYLSSDRLNSDGGFDIYHFKEAVYRAIEGVVQNKNNSTPVAGLRVEYQPTKFPDEIFTSYTDENGAYRSEIIADDLMNVKIYENEDVIFSEKIAVPYPPSDKAAQKNFMVDLDTEAENTSLAKALEENENANVAKESYSDLDLIANEFRPGRKALLNNLYFEFASSNVSSTSEETLSLLLQIMKDNSRLKIQIAAHTDHVGSDGFNQDLSEKRANSVYNYLIQNGIQSSRLIAKGYGESKPIVSNDDEEGRALNRRIEIIVAE